MGMQMSQWINEFKIKDLGSALKESCSSGEKDTCTQVRVGRKTRKGIVPQLQDSNQNVVLEA